MASEHWDHVANLADRARRDVERFVEPETPPDDEQALAYLRDGVAPVVSVYVEGRTGEYAEFDDVEMALMERALNDWLTLYARCYGVEIEAAFTVREVAELVIETHNLRDTARLLTGVPERDRGVAWSENPRTSEGYK
jgi:hypothetical protein